MRGFDFFNIREMFDVFSVNVFQFLIGDLLIDFFLQIDRAFNVVFRQSQLLLHFRIAVEFYVFGLVHDHLRIDDLIQSQREKLVDWHLLSLRRQRLDEIQNIQAGDVFTVNFRYDWVARFYGWSRRSSGWRRRSGGARRWIASG